jgi:hypothetical protein
MTAGTAAVVGLAAAEAQHIDLAGVGERLERAVDGGETHVLAAAVLPRG